MLQPTTLLPTTTAQPRNMERTARSAYDIDRYAKHGLRRYLKMFAIPRPLDSDRRELLLKLPKPDELPKSHANRKLTIVNEPWHRLEFKNLFTVSPDFVAICLDSMIHDAKDGGVNLADPMYALPTYLSNKFYSHKECDIKEMKNWIALPLVTAMRVWHITFIKARVFRYSWLKESDHKTFQCALWAPTLGTWDLPNGDMLYNGRVLIAFQTPFVLTSQDMRDFIGCPSFPSSQGPIPSTLPSAYKLWAKIWDTCHTYDTRWFVLTSYTDWVFGVFSQSMRTVSVSPIYSFDCTSPTILEMLVYWMGSAMGDICGFALEDTMEPVPMDDMPVDINVVNARMAEIISGSKSKMSRPPRSVASHYVWPGQNDETYEDPNIDLQSAFEGEGSLVSALPVQRCSENVRNILDKWLEAGWEARYENYIMDEDNFATSVHMPSAEDVFNPNIDRGEWML